MDYMNQLPTGFGISLLQNPAAASFYESCTPEQKQAILNQVHQISSKQEMKAFIDNLPSAAL